MPITPEEITWSYRWSWAASPARAAWIPGATSHRSPKCAASAWPPPSFAPTSPPCPNPPAPSCLSIHVPRQVVEWQTDTATEARLVDHVMRTWTALGQEKPHWSVLSSENFLPGRIEETKASFYASGLRDWDHIATSLARHGRAAAEFARVVEYGCGVGRVTPHLARHFAHVTGIDISAAH